MLIDLAEVNVQMSVDKPLTQGGEYTGDRTVQVSVAGIEHKAQVFRRYGIDQGDKTVGTAAGVFDPDENTLIGRDLAQFR